jgi:hypothetical protein
VNRWIVPWTSFDLFVYDAQIARLAVPVPAGRFFKKYAGEVRSVDADKRRGIFKMSQKVMNLKPGHYVWIACEVKPGPFSDERMVRVASTLSGEVWVGFAPVSALKEDVIKGKTSIKALVIDIQDDRFYARPLGSSLTHTLFSAKLSQAELIV